VLGKNTIRNRGQEIQILVEIKIFVIKSHLADGGSNHPENLEPKTHDEHVEIHKQNGDYQRWGQRAHAPSAGEATAGGAETGGVEAGTAEGAGALEAGEGGITIVDILEAAGALLF
jgi:hypothetical protein